MVYWFLLHGVSMVFQHLRDYVFFFSIGVFSCSCLVVPVVEA